MSGHDKNQPSRRYRSKNYNRNNRPQVQSRQTPLIHQFQQPNNYQYQPPMAPVYQQPFNQEAQQPNVRAPPQLMTMRLPQPHMQEPQQPNIQGFQQPTILAAQQMMVQGAHQLMLQGAHQLMIQEAHQLMLQAAHQLKMQGAQPQIMQGAQPQIMQGAQPQIMQGAQPQIMQGAQPQIIQGAQPQIMQGAQPQIMHGAQPQIMQGAQPQIMHGAQPQIMHGAQPQIIQGAQPQIMQGAQPQIMHGAQPQIMQGARPQIMQGAQPQIMQGAQPQIMQGAHPQIMQGAHPQIIQGAQPRIMHGAQPQIMQGDQQVTMPGQPTIEQYHQPPVAQYQQLPPQQYQQPKMYQSQQQPTVREYQDPVMPQTVQQQPRTQEYEQPIRAIQPAQWNSNAPVFTSSSTVVATNSASDPRRNSENSSNAAEKQEETPPATNTSTARPQEVILLEMDNQAGPSSSSSSGPKHASERKKEVQNMHGRHGVDARPETSSHSQDVTTGDDASIEQLACGVRRVRFQEGSDSIPSTSSTQIEYKTPVSKISSKDTDRRLNRISIQEGGDSVPSTSSTVSTKVEVHTARDTQLRPPVVDAEGFQNVRANMSRYQQEPLQPEEALPTQQSPLDHDVETKSAEGDNSLVAKSMKDANVRREQKALKNAQIKKQKAEKLAKKQKAKEEDEAALREAFAANEGFREEKQRLKLILNEYQKCQTAFRRAFANSSEYPVTTAVPWIVKDIILFRNLYKFANENSASEFLQERLAHFKHLSAKMNTNRYIAIYEVLIENKDEIVIQDFVVLREMLNDFSEYREYLENELLDAIFEAPEGSTPIPKITVNTDPVLPNLQNYLSRHSIRRYSNERQDNDLDPAEVSLIVTYKQSSWMCYPTLTARSYFLQRSEFYASNTEPSLANDSQCLAVAFNRLAQVPSPILAHDATYLHHTGTDLEKDKWYISFFLEAPRESDRR